ncbi:MAG: hypothetical protein ACFFAS_20485 [Promethearchaeota archaeon]
MDGDIIKEKLDKSIRDEEDKMEEKELNKLIRSHLNNRIAFISVFSGFLLSIIFQLALVSKEDFDNEKLVLYNFTFISLLLEVLLFTLSFIFLLMASSKMNNKEYEKFKKYIKNSLDYGRKLALYGIYCFALILYYLIRLYFYSYKEGKLIIISIAFIVNFAYLGLLYLFYFYFRKKWGPIMNHTEKSMYKRNNMRFILLVFLIETLIIISLTFEYLHV